MSLAGLRTALSADPIFARVRAFAGADPATRSADIAFSAPAGMRPVLLAEMADGLAERSGSGPQGVMLAVTATGREAEDTVAALRSYLPESAIAEFPSWETLPHERLSPRSDTVGRRLAVLRRLAHPELDAGARLRVIVAPIGGLGSWPAAGTSTNCLRGASMKSK